MPDSGRCLQVVGFGEFQHYRDRRPPWIKLYAHLLRNYRFAQLTETQRLHLILIWILASQMENRIPWNPAWIGSQIMANTPVDIDALVAARFLVVRDASKSLADCQQSARLETETETETERTSRAKEPARPKPKAKPKPKAGTPDDPRRIPLRDCLFLELRNAGVEPLTDASDWRAFEAMLKATRGKEAFTIGNLTAAAMLFARSTDPFDRRQGHPIRYFSTNLTRFMRPARPGRETRLDDASNRAERLTRKGNV